MIPRLESPEVQVGRALPDLWWGRGGGLGGATTCFCQVACTFRKVTSPSEGSLLSL